jgi:ubiquinone/menaquinone biosynthesis C-methylase UbiE
MGQQPETPHTETRPCAFSGLLQAGTAVLDVGCCTGAISADIAKIVVRGGPTLGLARDDSNLAIARQRDRYIDNPTFENGDILTFDFESAFKKPPRVCDGGAGSASILRDR